MTTFLKWLEWEGASKYTTCHEINTMYLIYDYHMMKDIEKRFFK